MKRIAVVLSIAFLLAACGGKAKPMTAAAPDNTGVEQSNSESAPDGAAPGGDPESDTDGASQSKGAPKPDDPCSGDD